MNAKQIITYDVTGYADNPKEVRDELRIGLESIPGVKSVSLINTTSNLNLLENVLMASYVVSGENFNSREITSFFTDQGYKVVNGGSIIKC